MTVWEFVELVNWNAWILYDFLKMNVFEDIMPYPFQKDPIDYFTKKLEIETKCRKNVYDGRMLIEKLKYQQLLGRSMLHNREPVYIVSTPEGVKLFPLNDIKFEWTKRSCPKTTEFENNNKIDKEIALINPEDGIDLILLHQWKIDEGTGTVWTYQKLLYEYKEK